MIIKQDNIYRVASFVAGLQQAARGLLRVTVLSGSEPSVNETFSSAWLITETLAVVPDFVTSREHGSRYLCHHLSAPDKAIEADLLDSSSPAVAGKGTALLRLRERLPEQALTLEFRNVVIGEMLFVLHHPGGHPEQSLSIGRLVEVEGPRLWYDADTEPGSSGGPIFNARTWALVGMHVGATQGRRLNHGLSLQAILRDLRASPAWVEIARYHLLADVTAARRALKERTERAERPHSDTALAAAVRWNFDPKAIPPDQREQLRMLVSDPSAPQWVLRTAERQRLLRSAGSLDALREARGDEKTDDPGQQAIDRILEGPPYSLDEVEETALPYWLQAVRWFAELEPSLPSSAEVNRTLERRRVRSRLERMAGPDFRGRVTELDALRSWYQNKRARPLVVSGIGGVGKTSLVARFAAQLPPQSLLLWLDFDRADLAPDDAISVLSLLAEQAAVQFEEFAVPLLDETSWQESASRFGDALAHALKEAPGALLVLDGFEVAQHVRQHQEIWKLLELILARVRQLRVIVSGRAPVENLRLNRRKAAALHLAGMASEDSEAWLREHGIVDRDVLRRVLDLSHGIPLVLRLAVRLVQAGGKIQELPDALPEALVEGFLYQRILDRVIDPLLKPVARDALVLRGVTAAMIPVVLADSVPEQMDAAEVFSRLAQELGLVSTETPGLAVTSMLSSEEGGMLRLRPEVRAATLRLLELDDDARVRTIDRRAAAWYAKQDLDDMTYRAELVYHRLRLGDVRGAEKVWCDACAPLLLYADEDLSPTADAERAWLRDHLQGAPGPSTSLEDWEQEAVKRIHSAIGRGLLRILPEILNERGRRSQNSPLVLYDAWTLWKSGDLEGARAALGRPGEVEGAVGRDRAVLGALLAADAGDAAAADELLASVDEPAQWGDRQNGPLELLALRAARVRLTVDFQAELALSSRVTEEQDYTTTALRQFLTPSDVVLPSLAQRLSQRYAFETARSPLSVPFQFQALALWIRQLDRRRREMAYYAAPLLLPLQNFGAATVHPAPSLDPWSERKLNIIPQVLGMFPKAQESWVVIGRDLAVLGWRRWSVVSSSLFLAEACRQALRTEDAGDPLSLSVVGTLAALHGQELGYFEEAHHYSSLDDVVNAALRRTPTALAPPPRADRVSLARKVLGSEREDDSVNGAITVWLKGPESSRNSFVRECFPAFLLKELPHAGLRALALYLLGPDPLEMLCRRVVGLPDNLAT